MTRQSEIFHLLKEGQDTSSEDEDFIYQLVASRQPDAEVGAAVRAFAMIFPPSEKNVKLLLTYMEEGTHPYVKQSAIAAISRYWRLTELILGRLEELMTWEAWSDDDQADAAIVAITEIGSYVHETGDRRLYQRLETLLIETLATETSKGKQKTYTSSLFSGFLVAREGSMGLVHAMKFKSAQQMRDYLAATAAEKKPT